MKMSLLTLKQAQKGVFSVLSALCLLAPCQAQTTGAGPDAPAAGNPRAGQYKVSMCIGCHGIRDYRTAYPEVYRVPKLGGQQASYIASALRDYRDGARRYETMRVIAASLSEQDIADIAAYYAQQKHSSPDNYLK